MPRRTTLYAGLSVALLGAALLLAPTFGFSTVSVDRLSGLDSATDDAALVGFEGTGQDVDNETDGATVLRLRNNADEALTLSTTVTTSPGELGIAADGAATLQPGETSDVTVECGTLDSERDASVAVTVEEASGDTLSVSEATSTASVHANCGPDRITDRASTETVASHRYGIENVESGLVAEVADGSTAEHASIQQARDAGASNQRFGFEYVGDGRYRLEPRHSGMAVGVADATRSAGGGLTQQSWNGTDHQLWHLEEVVEGEYRLVAAHSGLVAAVPNGSAEGAHLEQVEWTNATHQRWVLDAESASLTWATDADWSAGTHRRTVSDAVGDRANDTVRLGYNTTQTGLVSYWSFDEQTGTTAYDAAGANDGDHQNDPTLGAPGLVDTTAYDFDGSSQHVRVPDDPSLDFTEEQAVTVSAWVQPDTLSGQSRTAIVQKSDQAYNLQLHDDEVPTFTVYDGDWRNAKGPDPLQENRLYHLVGTYDGDTARIYVNGTEVGNASVPGAMGDSAGSDLGIGRNLDSSVDDRYFDATFDEVRIYDRSLSAGEVESLHGTSSDGTHVTGWKNSTVDLAAANASLQNVSATLDGETATVRVESDVDGDGTVDETSDPVTLAEGVSSYDVTGLSTDADRFRLRVNLSTNDPTASPVVSEVELRERLEDADFDVSIDDTNAPIEERETLSVTATVTNFGEASDTQTIGLEDFDGTQVDSTTVSLDGAESTQVTLSWATQMGDNGTDVVAVTSDNDTATQSVTIEAFERFTVSDVGRNVTGGERQYVRWTPAADEGDVHEFRFGDAHPEVDYGSVAESDVTEESGHGIWYAWRTPDDGHEEHMIQFDPNNVPAEESINFSVGNYQTGDEGGPWNVTLKKQSADTSRETASFDYVSVEQFDVAIESVDDPVVEGEPLNVTANVTNSGEGEGTQTIRLEDFDGTQADATDLTLGAGESRSVTLSWATQPGDNATANVTVRSADDSAEAEAVVQQQAAFDVTLDGTNSPIDEGEVLSANATITNDGETEATQEVALSTAGTQRDSQSVSLGSGASQSITLEWSTGDGDAGIYDAVVASESDSDRSEVSVTDPDGLVWESDADWSGGTHERTVSDGAGDRVSDTVRLGYNTTDPGLLAYWHLDEDSGTTAVDAANGYDAEHVQDDIGQGEPGLLGATAYNFTYDDSYVSVPSAGAPIAGDDMALSVWLKTDELGTNPDNGNNQTPIVHQADYDNTTGFGFVDDGDYYDQVTFRVMGDGNRSRVNVTRSLVNDDQWHQLVAVREDRELRLYLDGELQDTTTNVSLDPHDGELGIGSWSGGSTYYDGHLDEVRLYNRSLSTGEVQSLHRTTADGTHTTRWRPSADPLAAGSLALANVSSTLGGENATVYVESDVDGEGTVDETSDPVNLTGGTDSYDVTGLSTDPDRVRLRVEADTGDLLTTPIVSRIDVVETANFDVTIDGTNEPVDEGEVLSATATVTNDGGVEATQDVTLSTAGTQRDSQSVSLGSGESQSITLEWSTGDGDAGIYDAVVASESDSDRSEVSVTDPDGLVWATDADWSAGSHERTVSDGVGDRASDTVRLGYDAEAPGLIGYFPLDGESGDVVDASEYGNHGSTYNGTTRGTPGLLNTSSFGFDGTDDTVRVPYDPVFERSAENTVAVSAWVNPDTIDTSGRTAIAQLSDYSYNLQLVEGKPTFSIYENDDAEWTIPSAQDPLPETDRWYHMVGTYDGSTSRVYLDGELVASGNVPNLDDPGEKDLGIGHNLDQDGRYFDGEIEEVRLYGGNLTESEVQSLYQTADTGTHTTDWRPTGDPLAAGALELENVSATLGGENATVYVESDVDHDGAVDETSDPVSLTAGADTYDVTGLSTDPDRVRLRVEADTGDVLTTPIVSRIDVAEAANYAVTVDDTDSPVTEGETLSVNATVENTGEEAGNQTVELRDFDGTVVDETQVELAAGETASPTLQWTTQSGDAGTDNVTVASADDAAEREVSVQIEGTYFATTIDDTNAPVVEGDDLDVNVTVENLGDTSGTQTIDLANVSDVVVDSATVTLGAGESTSITLTWNTSTGDAGTGSVTVSSEDDSAVREVTVESAGPDVYFQESFEGGQTNNVTWTGNSWPYEVNSSYAWQGTYSLNHHGNDPFWSEGSPIETNSTIVGHFRANEDGYEHPMVVLGADADDGVGVGLSQGGGDTEFFLAEYSGGTRTDLDTPANLGDANGQWWRVELDVEESGDDLLLEARVYSASDDTLQATLSGTITGGATDYGSSGSLGFRGEEAWYNHYYWDDIRAQRLSG